MDVVIGEVSKSGDQQKLDPSIDNGKWFAAKVLKESSDLQENGDLTLLPFIPSTGRRAFPSNSIPFLFIYGHVHYFALGSILLHLDIRELKQQTFAIHGGQLEVKLRKSCALRMSHGRRGLSPRAPMNFSRPC